MHERGPSPDSCKVSDCRQVHYFLDAAGAEHGEAGIAAAHHVGMVSENAHRVRADGTGCHMKHYRQAFAGDPVKHGDHQHKSLAGSVAGSQGACLGSAVDGGYSACLGLHLHHSHRLSEDILPPFGGPEVGVFRHRGRRCDGIDRCYLGKLVSYAGGGFIAVHRHSFLHLRFIICRVRISQRPPRASCI